MSLGDALRIAVCVVAIAAAPAFAASEKMLEHADKVLESAKTTLSQAISAAEVQVNGKALSARLERWHGHDFYDVRVVSGEKLIDVHVAIDDGKILSTRPIEHGHMAKAKVQAVMPEKTQQSTPADANPGK